MNNSFDGIAIFAVGAAVGVAASWKFFKKKYERIAQEEIDSVKEVFSRNRTEEPDESTVDEKPEIDQAAVDAVNGKAVEYGYVNYADITDVEVIKTETKDIIEGRPQVIPPDEFGDCDGYDQITFTYYADGILTDELNEIVENVEETVGFESLTHFGEWEDDAVHVRNDRLKCDYEILLDQRDYADTIQTKPRRVEE